MGVASPGGGGHSQQPNDSFLSSPEMDVAKTQKDHPTM